MKYDLCLFVAGRTGSSIRARKNMERIASGPLKGRCSFEVVDIYEHPEIAEKEKILAIPTLIKRSPPPVRRIIGDLGDVEQLLYGLDLAGEDLEDHAPKNEEL
ncbi:MAG: circadian clock protein KaiB [Candidatus Eisenbacteria bacterium]|nr:circadian clock protein KaiB [Candidatus Eisenbacteria bacterium]